MTLPAYLDAVEQGRIPADEIAHETRLARTAFKEALAEAVRAEREACAQMADREGTHWHSAGDADLTDYGRGSKRAARSLAEAIRSRPSPARVVTAWPDEIQDSYSAGFAAGVKAQHEELEAPLTPSEMRAIEDTFHEAEETLDFAASLQCAVAYGIAHRLDVALARKPTMDICPRCEGCGYQDPSVGSICVDCGGSGGIPARPSPDVAVVPEPVIDAVNRVLRERGILLTADVVNVVSLAATMAAWGHWERREPETDQSPPPDLAAMRRVVEAINADEINLILAEEARPPLENASYLAVQITALIEGRRRP